jgi:serine/threonine protein kinase
MIQKQHMHTIYIHYTNKYEYTYTHTYIHTQMRSKGRLKLSDFGLACSFNLSAGSCARTRVGSDWYHSPEKANGDNYGTGV